MTDHHDTTTPDLLEPVVDDTEPATKKNMLWECNECGSQEYTMAVSEVDVQWLGCGSCGGDEWHRAEERA